MFLSRETLIKKKERKLKTKILVRSQFILDVTYVRSSHNKATLCRNKLQRKTNGADHQQNCN